MAAQVCPYGKTPQPKKIFIYTHGFLRHMPKSQSTTGRLTSKILVTATTFPRWKNDTEPAFVYELSRRLAKKGHDITVLAPHHKGAKKFEIMDGMKVYRFQYFWPSSLEKLCYDGGILPNLRKYIIAKIEVPFLLLTEFI